jgi:hypothetical protein
MGNMGLKRKIKQDVQKRQKEKPPGVFLNNRENQFTHDARMPEDQRQKAYDLFKSFGITGYKEKQKLLDFDILLANLLRKRDRSPVVISYAWKDWKASQYTRASYFVIDLIEIMENRGLIEMKKGIYTDALKRKTRIWPTKLLLDQFPELYSGVYIDPVNLVVLHDENKKPIPYKDTAFTRKVKSILSLVNSVNKQASMEYQGQRLYNPLIAVFNRKFTLYGRLHTKGHRHFQGMPEDRRIGLKINGESVVELDYSGLHPRLLYSKEGIQFNDDPYRIVHDDPRTRPFMKKLLLFMLNSKDRTTAEKAGNFWLYQNRQERRILKSIGITKAGPTIKQFMEAHKPISHFLCKGKTNGLRTMNLDAKIALDVVHHFAKQGIPIMPVHDSFVVQARHKDELYRVMDETYHKHTKGFKCPIK